MAEIKRKQYSVGDEYYGHFNQAGERHGYSVYRYSDGSVYIGGWSNNTCTGDGIYRANGEKYEGEFLCGKLHGNGIYYSSNGRKHIRRWINGEAV